MYARALAAETFGTFWLVLGGCGSAILAAFYGTGDNGTSLGLGFIGVSLAFGLTVLSAAYAVGHVSGGHFNPAVTIGLTVGGRFPLTRLPGYIVAQVIGGLLAGYCIFVIASGTGTFAITPGAGTFATNGYGIEGSPGGYGFTSALVTEVVLTAVFLIVIMGATARRAAAAMGGLAIGLCLTLIHFVSIPVTNTSVNPARSTSQAVIAFVFGDGVDVPIQQLWFFWVAPIVGAVIGALIYRALIDDDREEIIVHDGVTRTDAAGGVSRAAADERIG